MKSLMKHTFAPFPLRFASIVGLLLIFGTTTVVVPSVVHAEDTDPFQMDTGVWKSFDRYKEEQQQKLLSAATGDLQKDLKSVEEEEKATEEAAAKEAQAKADAPPVTATDSKPAEVAAAPVLAQPDRPINTPQLPALTTRFSVDVGTTADDAKQVAAAPSRFSHVEADPELQVAKHDWLNPIQVMQQNAAGEDGDYAHTPINIRLTMLPSYKAPTPYKKVAPQQVASIIAPPPAAPATDLASCAAVDAYKKRELQAIQSDRQTLAALQAAISELGLNKELSFMSGANSKINMPANNTASAETAAP